MAERKKYNFENAAKILATKTLTDPVIPVKEADEPDQDKRKNINCCAGKAKTD